MNDSVRIDPDDEVMDATEGVKNEIAELVGGFSKEGKDSGDELGLYEDWMPGKDDYQGKTHITHHQAHALAAVRQLPDVYEMLGIHVEGFRKFIIGLIEDYEQYATSIEGESREQQMKVLMAKAGVHAEGEEATRAMWARMLNGTGDEDE